MPKNLTAKLTQIATAAACTFMLAACGGGGDSSAGNSNSSNNAGGQPGASQALSLDAQKKGLSKDDNKYTMALSIGDTWRLALDPASLTYTLTVIQTAGVQGLQPGSTHQGSYTSNGNTLQDANGAWSLTINSDTQSITGQFSQFDGKSIVISGQTVVAQATGTNYETPSDLSRFKGTYFATGSNRNAQDGRHPWSYAGQWRVADDGKSATLCANGIFSSAGKCEAVDPSEEVAEGSYDLAYDDKTGLISASRKATGPQGYIHFQLSPLGGYTLVHDLYGKNEEGIMRTGLMYASQIPELKAGDLDGNFQCKHSITGQATASLSISGNSLTIQSPGYSATEVLTFNQVRITDSKSIQIPGIAESAPQGSPNEGAIIHPISRDQLVIEENNDNGNSTFFNICTRT